MSEIQLNLLAASGSGLHELILKPIDSDMYEG